VTYETREHYCDLVINRVIPSRALLLDIHAFDHEERAALLKFTWGRTRLPLSAGESTPRFQIHFFNKSPPDAYYPVAHTCFFSLELPHSTLKILRDKRYAIFDCEAIDGDDGSSGMAVAAMGWEE